MAEKPLTVLKRGTSKPFSRSKCTSCQVLNFGNNILHFHMAACIYPMPRFMQGHAMFLVFEEF